MKLRVLLAQTLHTCDWSASSSVARACAEALTLFSGTTAASPDSSVSPEDRVKDEVEEEHWASNSTVAAAVSPSGGEPRPRARPRVVSLRFAP